MNKTIRKLQKPLLIGAASASLALGLNFAPQMSQPAHAGGTVPANVQKGIDDAVATIGALDTLALAALTVALMPLGAMLTLRFLNMVLSRV